MQIVSHKETKTAKPIIEYGVLDRTGLSELKSEVRAALKTCIGIWDDSFIGYMYSYNPISGIASIENIDQYSKRTGKTSF
jgi:hypothetical protein